MKDPWTILGIPRTATPEEIRARYRKLALSLHPDKHAEDLTPEQRRSLEDQFKEVTVAYQVATDMAKRGESGNLEDLERWKQVWESMEAMIRDQNLRSMFGDAVKGTIKDLARAALTRLHVPMRPPADNASDISSTVDSESESDSDCDLEVDPNDGSNSAPVASSHVFKLSVTLEEVHMKSYRKVRLFLSDYPEDPLFLQVNMDSFPEMVTECEVRGRKHKIVMEMKPKKHPVYYWDPIVAEWDLYTTIPIHLYEYFRGCIKTLPGLGSAPDLSVVIPPFPSVKQPIVFEGLGLRNRGNLYVMVEVRLPTEEMWKIFCGEEPEGEDAFIQMCKKIDALHTP